MIEKTSKKSLIALREKQHKAFWSDAPGTAYNAFTEHLNAHNGPAFGLSLDSGESVLYDGEGNRYKTMSTRKDKDGNDVNIYSDSFTTHRGWVELLRSKAVAGSTPCVAEIDGTRFGAGLFIVVGSGSVGKTPFAHALAALMVGDGEWGTARFGEPLAGYHSDFDELVDDIAYGVCNERVTVVDSFKNVIATAGGTTAAGGLSRGAFNLFSDLGALAATRGCAVIIAVNPSASDPKVLDLLIEATKSNSTTLITTADGFAFTAYSRTGEGLLRVTSDIFGEYSNNVMTASVTKGASKRSQSVKTIRQNSTITNDEMSAALARMFSN